MMYIVLFASIALLAMSFFVRTTFFLNHRDIQFNQVTYAYTMVDMVGRMLEEAPVLKSEYKCLEPHAIIWHDANGKQDIAIQTLANKFVIIKGLYDKEQKKWLHKRTQVLFDKLAQFDITYSEKQLSLGTIIESYTLLLKTNFTGDQIKKTIVLKNKIYEYT